MKTNKERKSIRKALQSIQLFIDDFAFENQERYDQLFGCVNSDCNLPDLEKTLIMNYIEEFLDPDNDIFRSSSYPDVVKYSCTDFKGRDCYEVLPGKEKLFLSRLRNVLADICDNFAILKRMCA